MSPFRAHCVLIGGVRTINHAQEAARCDLLHDGGRAVTQPIALATDSSMAAQPADDEACARAAAAGDDDAFACLYATYYSPVHRYLRNRTANADDAADMTQQVFLKAYASLGGARLRSNGFAPWLFRIARNAAIDGHRRSRLFVPWDRLPGSTLPPAPDPGPEEAALASEQRRYLYLAIGRLDHGKQELLALRFAGGLSSRQIAGVVGKSESAVKKQLTRTIQSLKELYDAEFPPQPRH